MFGIPFDGLHPYSGSAASVQIKLASLIPVVNAYGPIMAKGETVTLFNDMCVLAPATLIQKNITCANVRWFTPLKEYREFHGQKVASSLEAVWHMPKGEFVYAHFHLTALTYNVKRFSE